jgi:hypothetical protein
MEFEDSALQRGYLTLTCPLTIDGCELVDSLEAISDDRLLCRTVLLAEILGYVVGS